MGTVVPYLPRAVGPRMAHALLRAPIPPECPLPESRLLDRGLSFLLRGMDARLWQSGAWDPLYRDWKDGRSFNGLLKGVLHYTGPAILIIRAAGGLGLLGAMSNHWEEGGGKYGGNAECILFALQPTMQVYRPTGRSQNFVYLNSRNKHAPRGLGFGGQAGCCRLWIDASFDECQVLASEATFTSGPLLPTSEYQMSFKISQIEIWGAGGDVARAAQAEQRGRDDNVRNQARKVDRSQLIETEFDREMFFGNTFKASEGCREESDVTQRRSEDS